MSEGDKQMKYDTIKNWHMFYAYGIAGVNLLNTQSNILWIQQK